MPPLVSSTAASILASEATPCCILAASNTSVTLTRARRNAAASILPRLMRGAFHCEPQALGSGGESALPGFRLNTIDGKAIEELPPDGDVACLRRLGEADEDLIGRLPSGDPGQFHDRLGEADRLFLEQTPASRKPQQRNQGDEAEKERCEALNGPEQALQVPPLMQLQAVLAYGWDANVLVHQIVLQSTILASNLCQGDLVQCGLARARRC